MSTIQPNDISHQRTLSSKKSTLFQSHTNKLSKSTIDSMNGVDVDGLSADERCHIPPLKMICMDEIVKNFNAICGVNLPCDILKPLLDRLRIGEKIDDYNLHVFATLAHIDVHSNPITDRGMSFFAEKSKYILKSLVVSGCENITDNGIRAISRLCPNLEVLNISDCYAVTDKGISSIAEHSQMLKELDVSNLRHLTDKSAKCIFQMPNLKRLNLSECTKISDKAAKEILGNTENPGLTHINLSRCSGLSTNGLRLVLSKCKHLQHLILDQCSQVTDLLVTEIVYNSKDLKYLSLCSTPNVTEDSLTYFRTITHKCLETLEVVDNPQLNLPDVRSLVVARKFKIVGAPIEIVIMRNRMTLPRFSIHMNEYDTMDDLVKKIVEYLNVENPTEKWQAKNFRLRKVTYRKNGTKRPGNFLASPEYSYLVREVLERKHHLYLDQDIETDFTSNLRLWSTSEGDIFITIRIWNPIKRIPEDVVDITVNSSMTLLEFKRYLCRNRIVSFEPQNILIVEEETDLRTNILIADTLTLALYGIISGDVIHVEEITPLNLDSRGQVVRSMIAEYLMKKKTQLSIQETEESFERRKKNLGFRCDVSPFKFEVPIKASWSFFKVKKTIAKYTGIGTEFLRISTRVEPHVYLYGNTKSCVDVLSGNLWLLVDINSEEMLQEKIPIWIQRYDRNSLFMESKCITVRKTATIKLLKEMIYEHFGIRDDRQILSRLSSKIALSNQSKCEKKSQFLKTIYTRDDLTISEAGIRYIRVDELNREIGSNDLVIHVIKYVDIKQNGLKSQVIYENPKLFLVSADSNLYDLKRELIKFLRKEKLLTDKDIYLKISNDTSLNKDSFFDVKSSFYSQDSNVTVSTFLNNQDILSWSPTKF